jgi:hypothetical protein
MTFRAMAWIIRDAWHHSLAASGAWLVAVGLLGGIALGLLADTDGQIALGNHVFSAYALAGAWLPNTLGMVLALVATAGFLPNFLEPRQSLILFAKPPPRWQMLIARYVAICCFVAGLSGLYFIGSWGMLGLRTNSWPISYFTGWLVFVMQYTAYSSFSALLAVATRSTPVVALGAGLFWLLAFLTNLGRHALVAYAPPHFQRISHVLIELCYWLLPRPFDAAGLLHDSVSAERLVSLVDLWRRVVEADAMWPAASILATVVFTLLMIAAAGYDLETRDI